MAHALPRPPQYFVDKLLDLGRLIRTAVVQARGSGASLSRVARPSAADTLYELDTHVEPVIESFCDDWSRELPLVLIAEGLHDADPGTPEGIAVFPRGTDPLRPAVRIICDPIDGTRGLMYDKRSAWFLAGIAPNHGDATRLSDIAAAVQVEIPTAKQNAADLLWAIRGSGAHAQRKSISRPPAFPDVELPLAPSQAGNIDHGFATISNFFPGTKELAARLMEHIVQHCLGPANFTEATVFDDQYISTGGQLYELMTGHDRFNADLRPLFYQIRGMPVGMSVHPYDLAGALIASEAGVELTDGLGGPLDAPLDITTPLSWAGFANKQLRARIEPAMLDLLRQWRKA